MGSTARIAAIVLGLFTALAAAQTPAASQTPSTTSATVSRGGSAVVAREPQIAVTAEPSRGRAVVVDDPSAPGRHALLYYAPPADQDYDDELRYTSAGGPERIVRIAARSPTLAEGAVYTESLKQLFVLFVLAVLVESALALLFRWRPYLDYVNSAGLNALLAFAVSLVLVASFDLDVVTRLVNIYAPGSNFASGWMGKIVTALIVAGGSAGVNSLLRALGFREIVRPEAEVAKPPPTKAWLSVTHDKGDADGPVDVIITVDGTPAVARTMPASAGGGWWSRNFLRDRGRFPPSGGYVLTPGAQYQVVLEGSGTRDGQRVKVRSATWGPHDVMPGAIIDLRLTPRFPEPEAAPPVRPATGLGGMATGTG